MVLRDVTEPLEACHRRAYAAFGADGWRQVDGHVWVLTPEEMREQLRRGDTAVRDAVAKGERLFPEGGRSRCADLAGEWSATGAKETLLEKARDDLANAEVVLETGGARWQVVACRLPRPAGRREALQALIGHPGGEPERTHTP